MLGILVKINSWYRQALKLRNKNMKKSLVGLAVISVIAILIYTQITLFVIQPIGIIPEGKTLVILRLNKTEFIDSADAMCEREMGGVNLFCRIGMLGAVTSKSEILFRLPYSSVLYEISTGGVTYDR
jgi:hypothetical protein